MSTGKLVPPRRPNPCLHHYDTPPTPGLDMACRVVIVLAYMTWGAALVFRILRDMGLL